MHRSPLLFFLSKVSQIREVMDRELGYVESKDKGKREGEKVFVLVHSKKVIGCTIAESISEGFPVILNKSRKKTKGNSTSDVGAQESPASSQSDTPEPSSSCSPPSPSQNDNSSNNNDSSSQSSQSSNNKTNANNNNNNSNNKNSSKNTRKKQHISNNSSECVNESESESGMSASEDIVVCSKTAQPAVCGISRIWMHRAHRRQGHASKLLDAVRCVAIFCLICCVVFTSFFYLLSFSDMHILVPLLLPLSLLSPPPAPLSSPLPFPSPLFLSRLSSFSFVLSQEPLCVWVHDPS